MDKARAEHYLDLVTKLKTELEGPNGAKVSDQLENENQQLGQALEWFIEQHDTIKAQTLASLLYRFWIDKGHVADGRKLMAGVLSMPHEKNPTRTLAELLFGAGMLAFRQNDNKEAEKLFQEALTISRRTDHKLATVRALTGLARTALHDGNYDQVRARSGEARKIAKDMGDGYAESRPLHMFAAATKMEGDLEGAKKLYEESLALARKIGDESLEATELDNLGSVALEMKDPSTAKKMYRQAGELVYKQRSMYMLPYVPLHLGQVALEEGKFERAIKLLGAADSLFEQSGMTPDPDEIGGRDRAMAKLRETVDRKDFEKHWGEGRKLNLDQTIQFAFEN